MKKYHVSFSDDGENVHGVIVWARNDIEATYKAIDKINNIVNGKFVFSDEDIVAVERLYKSIDY